MKFVDDDDDDRMLPLSPQRVAQKRKVYKIRIISCDNSETVNSCSCSLYVVVRPSVFCRLSVTLVHPTQPIEIFGNVSAPFNTLVT